MSDYILDEIKDKLSNLHEGDQRQLEVVFSSNPRIIVEAPAGYGKTTTMVSRIAYLYVTGGIPNPKKVLGLTFSVNAALKIKREVAEKLPVLLGLSNNPVAVGDRVTVTNFHGFCKGVLKKYGYLISDMLRRDINIMKGVGISEIEKRNDLKRLFSVDELAALQQIERDISRSHMPSMEDIQHYNDIVLSKLIPKDYITHDAVILMTIQLFEFHKEIKEFYSNYYPLIVIDEFQDTNCMAWELLKSIITHKTQLLFLGDSLQRIYGFIGALPEIMNVAAEEFHMQAVSLDKNYRFRNNREMLILDYNVRANAANNFAPDKLTDAILPSFWGKTQDEEANLVLEEIKRLKEEYPEKKFAILFRSRGENAVVYEKKLLASNMPYFYGMFTDDDPEYVDFHVFCRDEFINRFGKKRLLSKKKLVDFANRVKEAYQPKDQKAADSLIELLFAQINKVSVDYVDLRMEEKYDLLLDIFENRQLKQAMEYIQSNLLLSTVHGAKGLEWDYVFLGDLERMAFPGYYTCKQCVNLFKQMSRCRCVLPKKVNESFLTVMLDELSVFYVALTRARKQVYVAASGLKANNKDSIFSCMASLCGIKIVDASK